MTPSSSPSGPFSSECCCCWLSRLFLAPGREGFCGDYDDDDDEVLMRKEEEKETGWRANKKRILQQPGSQLLQSTALGLA